MMQLCKTIAGIPLTSENYDHSVALLKERFGQTHNIVNKHMQALLALSSPSINMVNLHSFYDSVDDHIMNCFFHITYMCSWKYMYNIMYHNYNTHHHDHDCYYWSD